MKLADLKWAAGIFVAAALRPAGHEDCECHPKLRYRGPRQGFPKGARAGADDTAHEKPISTGPREF